MKIAAVVAVIAATLAAHADEIVLENGDVLRGEIISLADGKLVFKTEYAGEVTIDWTKAAGASSERAIAVETRSGARMLARIERAEAVSYTHLTLPTKRIM